MRLKPVSVGLVGAGPWARVFHAPMIARGPETNLSAVWARRREAAVDLATQFGAIAALSIDELVERCDVVAFAVPPDIQAALAPTAAVAGRALLLEKPLALTLESAERMVENITRHNVPTILMLTNRFSAENVAFIEQVKALEPSGGIATMLSGTSRLGEQFSTPWRIEYGALHDVGPHILDMLDVTLGSIVAIYASGEAGRWVSLVTEHQGGAVASSSLSLTVDVPSQIFRIEVFGEKGNRTLATHFDHSPNGQTAKGIRKAIYGAVREGRPCGLDMHRGLYLQRLLDAALRALSTGKRIPIKF